jgi:methylmalonyl-CoA mutase C-terminal domain/subunit
MTLVPRILALMRENEMEDVPLFLGGIIPDDDWPRLKEMGVYEIFGPGTSTEKITTAIRGSLRDE